MSISLRWITGAASVAVLASAFVPVQSSGPAQAATMEPRPAYAATVDAYPMKSVDTSKPNWHIAAFGYDKLHAEGFTGEGITIAITEAGIQLDAPDLEGADIEYVPLPEGCSDGAIPDRALTHGTTVASVLVGQGGEGKVQGIVPDAKLIVYQTSIGREDERCPDGIGNVGGRAMLAAENGVDIVSSSMNNISDTAAGYLALREIPTFEAAGNGEIMAAGTSPGSAAIGAHDADYNVPDWSARGGGMSLVAPGVGIFVRVGGNTGDLVAGDATSFAGPIAAGTLALGMQKYPEATGHQLMQSLARNTVGGNPDLARHTDAEGYGAIDPAAFMAADPTQYPDEPPFLDKPDYLGGKYGGIEDLLMGMDPYAGDDLKDYKIEAGPNPEVIEWLPQEVEGFVGQAPRFDEYWGDKSVDDVGGGDEGNDEPAQAAGDSDGDSGLPLTIGLIAGGVLLAVLVTVIVVASRRGKNRQQHRASQPAMGGGQPQWHSRAPGQQQHPGAGYRGHGGYPPQGGQHPHGSRPPGSR